MSRVQLTNREMAIVLASLRIAQEDGLERLNAMEQMAEDGVGAVVVEDLVEIDGLCEKINCRG